MLKDNIEYDSTDPKQQAKEDGAKAARECLMGLGHTIGGKYYSLSIKKITNGYITCGQYGEETCHQTIESLLQFIRDYFGEGYKK